MAVVNLGLKYSGKIQQRFAISSLLQGRLENNVDFVGARTVRIHTISPVPVNDYDRGASANRYGIPEEVGDTIQELTMSQDKSFSGVIDKGNTLDQSINKAGKFVKVEMDEAMVPLKDRYGFAVLAKGAGTIVGSSTAISESNVLARMAAARRVFLNERVPGSGRTFYVRSDIFNALFECKAFVENSKLGYTAIAKGQIGELFSSPVVEVPDDLLLPGLNFIYAHKAAGSSPAKIADTKMHVDAPGYSGTLVEGRFYWDTFVFGSKAGGLYADFTTGSGVSVLAAPKVEAKTGAITVTSGAKAKYTLDGSDPRYSASALEGTAPAVVVPGTVMRAYQYKEAEGTYPSPVTTVTLTEA